MIDINLIPAALRKDSKGNANSLTINIPKETLVGVGAGLVFILVMAHLILGTIWLLDVARLSNYNAQWQKVLPDRIVLDAINKESMGLKKKSKMISEMTTQKAVLWAPKFNAISDSLPRGVWIRKMTLDRIGLTMEGSVVSKNQSEINIVDNFLTALKQNSGFMKGFSSLDVNSYQGGKNSVVEVTDFSVMAKLNETRLK